jgi:hypothetical protein
MATVTEALDYIKSHYSASLDDHKPGILIFNFTFTDDGRSQRLAVWGTPGSDFLHLVTPFALVAEHKARVILDYENHVFGVVRFGDRYALVHNLPVENLDHSEIEWSISKLATAGDEMEKRFSTTDRM